MKKKIKKVISAIFPKGGMKEKIKLGYYSINKPKDTFYALVLGAGTSVAYKTTFQDLVMITHEALYFIAPDFNYYQHFYKVKESDIVLDAGANCGHLSILFSKLTGKRGIVYAFEPDTYNVERIDRNIGLNNDLPGNIKIENLLLWDENKWIDFYEAGTVGSSAIWIPDNDKCVKKEAVRIDDWVVNNNINRLDFIKMDIEGAEIEALAGCEETIRNLKPNFAIASYHIVDGAATHIKVEAFFKKMNYPYQTVRFRKNEIITFAGPSLKK
jgi:FkbM family methyltransferase